MSLKLLILTTNNQYRWSNAKVEATDVIRKHGANHRSESYSSYGQPFFERNKPVKVGSIDELLTVPMPEPGMTDSQMAVYHEDSPYGIPLERGITNWFEAQMEQQHAYKTHYLGNALAKAERSDNSNMFVVALWVLGISTGLVALLGLVLVGGIFTD